MVTNKEPAPTWERVKRPMTGMRLRKPKSITRNMLERWDICHEGMVWFDHVTTSDKFPLTNEFIEQAFSRRVTDMRFRTVWFSWLAIRLFSDLSKQTTGNAAANRVLNAKLKEFMASVTLVSLRDLPEGIRAIEHARLGSMLVRILNEL